MNGGHGRAGSPDESRWKKSSHLKMSKCPDVKSWKKSAGLRQYAAAISATMIAACAGTAVGWPSPTLPILLGPNSHIPITNDESSWIASMMILASTVSPLPTAYLTEFIGRKRTLLIAGLPCIVGWLSIMLANSVVLLYVGRIIIGIGYGIAYTAAPMYLGEIASNELRGSMATLITVMSKLGILTQYCIGPYVSFKTLVGINLFFPILFILTFVFMPESPYYHLRHQQRDKAEKCLAFLRANDENNEELTYMQKIVTEEMENEGKWSELLTVGSNRRALTIIIGIYATQQLCGSTAVVTYCQQIFDHAGGDLTADRATIIFGVVQLLTATASSLTVDRLGRRPLLICSTLGVALANLGMATYFLLRCLRFDVEPFSWLMSTFAAVYISSYAFGLATVPFAVTSEVFTTDVKSKATCLIQAFVSLMTFAVTKLFQVVADAYGVHVVFFAFCGFSFLGLAFIVGVLPEMKRQSFETIRNTFSSKNNIKV